MEYNYMQDLQDKIDQKKDEKLAKILNEGELSAIITALTIYGAEHEQDRLNGRVHVLQALARNATDWGEQGTIRDTDEYPDETDIAIGNLYYTGELTIISDALTMYGQRINALQEIIDKARRYRRVLNR